MDLSIKRSNDQLINCRSTDSIVFTQGEGGNATIVKIVKERVRPCGALRTDCHQFIQAKNEKRKTKNVILSKTKKTKKQKQNKNKNKNKKTKTNCVCLTNNSQGVTGTCKCEGSNPACSKQNIVCILDQLKASMRRVGWGDRRGLECDEFQSQPSILATTGSSMESCQSVVDVDLG
jgi:hypothetical protein